MHKQFASLGVRALVILLAAAAPRAHGQATIWLADDLVRLEPPDLVKPDIDRFGESIAAQGNTVLVSAAGDSGGHGAVYVFERRSSAQWDMTAKIVSPDGAGGNFGSKVDLSGNTAAIKEGPVVHIFVKQGSSWIRQARLQLGGVQADIDAAIDGDRLFIVSRRTGMAYAYRRGPAGGWNRQTQVEPDTNAPMFYSVAMSNGLAIVGAPTAFGALVIPNSEGSVYVYRLQAVAGQFDQWVRETRLHPPLAFEDEESFGLTLDVWGNRIAVGSRRESDFRGAVYVFARGTDNRWRQTARLTPKDTLRHCFSEAVSIYFDRISVSAPCISDGQSQSTVRSVHVFQRNVGTETWRLRDRLFPGEGAVPIGTAVSDCGVFMGVPGGGSPPAPTDVAYVMPSPVCAPPISR